MCAICSGGNAVAAHRKIATTSALGIRFAFYILVLFISSRRSHHQQFRKVVEISSLAAGGLIFLGETLASVFGRRGFRPSLRTPHLCSAVGLDLNVKERAREKLESSPTPKGFQFFPPLDAAVQLFGKFHQGNFQLEQFPMYPDKDLKEVHC